MCHGQGRANPGTDGRGLQPRCHAPDFHALTEVWLDSEWHLVDATGMCHAESTAVIAVGRDAYDIAFLDSQAPAEMLYQSVQVMRT